MLSSSGFLDSWSTSSFTSYKTPPKSKSRRQRTESEQSSGDFTSVAGIAAILKGKLVPKNVHVSPSSGMVVTPPARKQDSTIMPSPSKIHRTRHRSKEIANEINREGPNKATDNLIETLGLSISSSSADESSPVKKAKVKTRKRKRGVLGFSETPQLSSAKRTMQL